MFKNPVTSYLYALFVDVTKRFNQKQYITAIAFLWVLNSFSTNGLIVSFISTYFTAEKGSNILATNAILNTINEFYSTTYIPWSFILLVCCILVSRKLYSNLSYILWALIGVLIYTFFKSLIALPYLFISDTLSTSDEIIKNIKTETLFFKFWYSAMTIGGFLALIYPFFTLKKEEKSTTTTVNRAFFTRKILYLNLIFISINALTFIYAYVLGARYERTVVYLLVTINILIIGYFIFFLIKRIINTGKNPLIIFIYILFNIITNVSILLIWKTGNILVLQTCILFMNIGITASSLFILAFMILPEKENLNVITS